jgi:hypothetical protein
MEHNQQISALYLAKVLAIEPRINTADVYAAIVKDLSPKLELAEYRVAMSGWIHSQAIPGYEIVRGRFGGIRKLDEAARVSKAASESTETLIATDSDDSEEGLIVYITPNMRLYQSDSRNWVIQKRNGDVWVGKYYQNSLDAIINSVIRHTMNGEFKVTTAKINELKDMVKVINDVKDSLEATFKAVIIEKAA